jgi:anti-anti-sigma factor
MHSKIDNIVRENMFDLREESGVIIIKPVCDKCNILNIFNCTDLNNFLVRIIDEYEPEIIALDLENVEYTDSSAVGVFISIDDYMKKTGSRGLILAGLNRSVMKVLERLEIESFFPVYPTVNAALSSVAAAV